MGRKRKNNAETQGQRRTRREEDLEGSEVRGSARGMPAGQAIDERSAEHVEWCYTWSCATVKTNVTLKLDAELLKEARVLAAEEGSSMSRLLAAKLEEVVRERRGYDRAKKRALARLRVGVDLGWTRPGSRDELHER